MANLPPYAEMIGARRNDTTGEPILSVSWSTEIQGRPGFIHGGVIAGLLEMACYEALHQEFGGGALPRFRPINVAVDYLRGGLMTDMHALAQIVRIGKRVANATALCWQDDRSKPIATARMHLLLDREPGARP
ncbi:MAG: PaaI family thioesterase [Rhizorhabdus sp.]